MQIHRHWGPYRRSRTVENIERLVLDYETRTTSSKSGGTSYTVCTLKAIPAAGGGKPILLCEPPRVNEVTGLRVRVLGGSMAEYEEAARDAARRIVAITSWPVVDKLHKAMAPEAKLPTPPDVLLERLSKAPVLSTPARLMRPPPRKVTSNAITRLVTLAAVVGVVAPLGYVAVPMIGEYRDYASQRTTTAIVDGKASGGWGGLCIYYRFSVTDAAHPKGVLYTHWVYGVTREVFDRKRGSPVTITYLARNPDKSALGDRYPLHLMPWSGFEIFSVLFSSVLLLVVLGPMFVQRHKRMARARRLLQSGVPTIGLLVRHPRRPDAGRMRITINGIPIYSGKIDKADDKELVRYDYSVGGRPYTNYAPDWEFKTDAGGQPVMVVYDPAEPSVSYPLRTISRYYLV